MAAKIAILGESTTTATGTATLYTVPLSKAARVRLLWEVANDGDATIWQLRIGTPGTESTISMNLGSNVDTGSNFDDFNTRTPTGAWNVKNAGVMKRSALYTGSSLTSTGGANNFCTVPYPTDYYLATGDTVDMIVTTGTTGDSLSQCQGLEDDV